MNINMITNEMEKPTKEEYAVAKYLKFNLPKKEGKFMGNNVQYFVGTKAVDILLESKWSSKNSKTSPLFTSRSSCVYYCERLLYKGFFHRVLRKEKRTEPEKKKKSIKDSSTDKPTTKDEKKLEKKSSKTDEGDAEKTVDETENGKEIKQKEEKSEKPKDDGSKKPKKKKLKLYMHDNQTFIDANEYYVWIYDPVPVTTFIIGLLLVLGAIAVCLFPLWPPEVRLGVYYLSLAAAGFVGLILALCIIRMIVFCIVWALTLGKVHIWLLPNLTEDVGFFESFRPLYKFERQEETKSDDKSHGDAGEDKKIEEIEKSDEVKEDEEEEEAENVEDDENEAEPKDDDSDQKEDESDQKEDESGVEEDISEPHSSTSNNNGYEFVEHDDVETNAAAQAETNKEQETGVRHRKPVRDNISN